MEAVVNISFEPCKHKYSMVEGVYVITQNDEFQAACNSYALLLEWLAGCTRKDVYRVKIYLSAVADFDKDEITHLIFNDRQGDYENYADWSEWYGPDVFMEHWFDEYDQRIHGADFTKRYRRWKEIYAATPAQVAALPECDRPALSTQTLQAAAS